MTSGSGPTENDAKKRITVYRIFLQVLECVIRHDLFQWHIHVFFFTFPSIHFIDTSFFHLCDTWSVHPFHKHFLYLKSITPAPIPKGQQQKLKTAIPNSLHHILPPGTQSYLSSEPFVIEFFTYSKTFLHINVAH